MKRGTPDHPKTLALSLQLGLRRWGAVGLLEMLWHFTAKYAPQGDVGKFPAWRYADCLRVGDVYALAEAVKEQK